MACNNMVDKGVDMLSIRSIIQITGERGMQKEEKEKHTTARIRI